MPKRDGRAKRAKKRIKYYAFVDVAIDVFFSIILYNAFISFPGLNLGFALMILAVFVMINYWWISRAFVEEPKYYLIDLYFLTAAMFLFAIWPSYFTNIKLFTLVMALVWLVDAAYSLTDIPAHKERRDERTLRSYFISAIVVSAYYFILYSLVSRLTWESLIFVAVPYLLMVRDRCEEGNIQGKIYGFGERALLRVCRAYSSVAGMPVRAFAIHNRVGLTGQEF